MDYDDNDAQDQNLHLGGEGSFKASSVLHSYTLPKFDFDDNLQGNLRFDSLVENEVFLGITSQEDNQWIEEYSRGTTAIQFSSSAAGLRRKNVWSEATSSESVEMLLKSVGQEEGVVEEIVVNTSDACDRPDILTNVMDPNLKQCDEKDHLISTPNAIVVDVVQENFVGADCEQPDATYTSQSQDNQLLSGELDAVVIGDKCGLAYGEKKVEKSSNIENDSSANELQQYSSATKVECGNAGPSHNVDSSIEECQENPQEVSEMCIENASGPSGKFPCSEPEQIIKSKQNSMDNTNNSDAFVKICTYSMESLSVVTNVESLDKPTVGGSVEPTGSLPIGSSNVHETPLVVFPSSGYVEIQEIEDAKTEPEIHAPESNVGSLSSLSLVQSHSVEEPENGVGSDNQQVTSGASNSKVYLGDNQFKMGEGSDINTVDRTSPVAGSSAEMATEDISSKGFAAANDPPNIHTGGSKDDDWNLPGKISGLGQVGDESHSSDKDVTFKERGHEGLPLNSRDMDMDVGGAPCTEKHVAQSSSGESCEGDIAMAQESESNMAVLTNAVAAMESSKIPSSDVPDAVQLTSATVATDDIITDSQPRSSLHDDKEEKVELGFSREGSSLKGTLEVDNKVDCALDGLLPVVKEAAVPDGAEKAVHRLAGYCDPLVGSGNASPSEETPEDCSGGLKCSKTLESNTLPCDSSAEGNSNGESGGLLDAKESMTGEDQVEPVDLAAEGSSNGESGGLLDAKESMTGEDQVEPVNLAVNMLDERQASSGPSESDATPVLQKESDSASLGKPQVFSLSDIKSIESSQSAENKHENAPLSKVSNDREGLPIDSTVSAAKEAKSFTFEVSASAGSGHTNIQNLRMSKNLKVSSVSSSGGMLDPNKLHEDSLVSPQTPSSAAIEVGSKGNSERKPRRKSVGRETAKKGDPTKERTPLIRSGRVEKSPALVTLHATEGVKPLEELNPNASIECSNPKTEGILPIHTSNLPNPNISTSILQQSFTDDQQLQLRAQILVYGSLISGMPPDELHMVAAFGQSDGGRRAWEAAWRASLDRTRGHKSLTTNPGTPMQSRPGNRDPDQGFKIGTAQSKVISTPTTGPSQACISSPVVTSMIPISSPLWNITTPCDGLQSSAVPRSPLLDYRQTLSPLHLSQTPQGQNFGGLNASWQSPGHFPGQWLSSSPIAAFGARFSALPITEAVKLTTVKESGSPGISEAVKLTTVKEAGSPSISVIPVDDTAGPNVSPGPSSLSNVRKAMVSSGQPSSDSKSRKRKKVSAGVVASQMSVASQAQVPSPSAHVPNLPRAPHTEGHNQITFLAQNQTHSGTTVVSSHPPISTASLIPIPITSKSNSGSFLSSISPTSNHDHPILGDQNLEKIVRREEIVSKIEESKLQAADAAVHAASAVSHCQGVWNQLEQQKSSGLVSDDEAMLVSSATSIAAAASVAKVAAAAAKIALNVAEQARLMANEVFQSSRTESYDQSGMISHANVISNFDKATPASILNSADGSDHPTSIISAAREAARRRIKAASAASKHAENLDAIVKAAELAAEAVSQAGKIVAMGKPLPLKELVEAGPEGYWKTPLSSNQQCNSGKQNVDAVSNDIHFLKHGLSLQEDSPDLAKNQMMNTDGMSGSITNLANDISTARAHKSPDSSKTVRVIPDTEFESIHTSDVNRSMPQSNSDTCKENNIKEGCFVEVCKDDNKNKSAWFAAKVLTLEDGKAFVSYNDIQTDEGSGQLKEWIPVEVKGTEPPRIRIAHRMTTMQSEGTRKRGRKALTDYHWCSGDRVDVWVQDSWCEAVVLETNKIDLTSLTVQFPAQGEKSVVRSWQVRPSLIWEDGKWIEWSNVKGSRSSEGDTPREKRHKFGSPGVEGTEKDKSSNIDVAESGRLQESSIFRLSAHGSSFDIGKSSRDEKHSTRRTIRSGLQKERSGVIFGVPRPGKKQKFMDVSKHYVANGSNEKNTPGDSVKLASYSMPQAPGHNELKNNSKNDAKDKPVDEIKSKLHKPRKPPIPSTLFQKDKPKSSKHMSHDASMNEKPVKDSIGIDQNMSGRQNRISNKDAIEVPTSSSDTPKETLTSKAISQRLNKRKFAPADGKSAKVEVKDKSTSEAEPRRSNRKIQPTSRLLEGLQSSLTMTKIATVSHASQRNYNKVSSKGSTNPG